uniref:Uncharacterized protein n=1 Tax=Tanacetum cinerariifolium TaxID=118510 RepID=A0A699HMZ4_TANCI|nr:hypothetical protein [Tanacetum cinerariifolium]
MLKGFDREDLDALWRLVKEKFSTTIPMVDKEKALWKADSDTSPKKKPIQATKGTRLKSKAKVAKPNKMKKSTKKTKLKGLAVLSKVALTEAEQIKLVTKRSKKDFHVSHASGSARDAGFLWERVGRGRRSNGNGREVERSGEEGRVKLAGKSGCVQCWFKCGGKTGVSLGRLHNWSLVLVEDVHC